MCDVELQHIGFNDTLAHFVDLQTPSSLTDFFLSEFTKSEAPLFRLAILETPEQSFLLMSFHHLIVDGWSMGLIIEKLNQYYNSVINQESLLADTSENGYSDFIVWENQQQAHRSEKFINYWMERLIGKSHIVDLMTDYPRRLPLSGRGQTMHHPLSTELVVQLNGFARSQAISLNQLLLFAFQFMLSRYSGQDDITVGIPVSGRAHSRWYQTIGLFVNTCLHTMAIDYDLTVSEQLCQVKKYVLADMEHANEPFDEVIKELYARKQVNPNNTFNILYNFIHSEVKNYETGCFDPGPSAYYCALPTSKFELSLHVFATDSTLDLFVEFSTDLYQEETMRQMLRYLLRLLETMPAYQHETLKTWTWALTETGEP